MTKFDKGFNVEYTEEVKKRFHAYPPHNIFLLILNLIKLACSLAYSILMIVYATLEPLCNTPMLVMIYLIGILVTSYAVFDMISEWRDGQNFKRAMKILKEQEDPDIQVVYADDDD